MRIAILGATGQIGRSLARAYAHRHRVTSFARTAKPATRLSSELGLPDELLPLDDFVGREPWRGDFDLVINAAGPGDPAPIRESGDAILDISSDIDRACTRYLEQHPECGYVFLSTGALFGPEYHRARQAHPSLEIPLRDPAPDLFYALAKRTAELRHRAHPELRICDVRIFGFVSEQLRLNSGFLIAQVLRALHAKEVFVSHASDVVRDYVGPEELVTLIDTWWKAGGPNAAYDLMSREPTSKLRILAALTDELGLEYRIAEGRAPSLRELPEVRELPEIRELPERISIDTAAAAIGFEAVRSSLDCVLDTARKIQGTAHAIAKGACR